MSDIQCSSFPCYAPVFQAVQHPLARLGFQIIDVSIMVSLILLTLGFVLVTERGKCLLRQYQFHIQNLAYGNPHPGISLVV